MAIFDGLFGRPAPAASSYGQPRNPFQRVFDPEAQRTTLTGFLGRAAGNPTLSERAGAGMGGLMQQIGKFRAEGMSGGQILSEISKTPEFMEAFIAGGPDIARLTQEILTSQAQMDQFGRETLGPNQTSFNPDGSVFASQGPSPTGDQQNFEFFASVAGLGKAERAELAKAFLIDKASGDGSGTATERAVARMQADGRLDGPQGDNILSGRFELLQQPVLHPVDGLPTGLVKDVIFDKATMQFLDIPTDENGFATMPGIGTTNPDTTNPRAGGGGFRLSIGQAPAKFQQFFQQAETDYGVPANLLASVAWQESRFNSTATSPKGAQGMMQFMPKTAKEYGVNPNDPKSSIDGAARYLKKFYNKYGQSWPAALIAYNAGEKRVKEWVASGYNINVLPDETRDYLYSILGGGTGQKIDFVGTVMPDSSTRPLDSGGAHSGRATIRPYQPLPGEPPPAEFPGPGGPDVVGEQQSLDVMEAAGRMSTSGFDAAFGSGITASMYGTIKNFLSNFKPEAADEVLNSRRAAMGYLQEGVVEYVNMLGRDSEAAAARVLTRMPNQTWDSPSDAITNLIELRRVIEEQVKYSLGVVADTQGQSREARQLHKNIANSGLFLMQQLGTKEEGEEALAAARRGEQLIRLGDVGRAVGEAFTEAEALSEEAVDTVSGGAGAPAKQPPAAAAPGGKPPAAAGPKAGAAMPAKQFSQVLEGLKAGQFPSDSELATMSSEQFNRYYETLHSLYAKGGKRK